MCTGSWSAAGTVTSQLATAWVSSSGVGFMFSVSIVSAGRWFESGSKDHENKV